MYDIFNKKLKGTATIKLNMKDSRIPSNNVTLIILRNIRIRMKVAPGSIKTTILIQIVLKKELIVEALIKNLMNMTKDSDTLVRYGSLGIEVKGFNNKDNSIIKFDTRLILITFVSKERAGKAKIINRTNNQDK